MKQVILKEFSDYHEHRPRIIAYMTKAAQAGARIINVNQGYATAVQVYIEYDDEVTNPKEWS